MALPSWISSLSDDEARQMGSDLAPVLESASERVHYAEARRGNYVATAAGLFAGAIALSSMAVADSFARFSWSLWALATGFFLLSVALFYLHSAQVNRYPWTDATNTWKWFYRDALPDHKGFDISLWQFLARWKDQKVRAKKQFTDQLPSFGDRVRRLRDERESLWQDVQQLYVLHVNEKYKNMYLTQLRSMLNFGLIATVVVASALLGFQFRNSVASEPSTRIVTVNSVAAVTLTWAEARGAICPEKCWLVNARIVSRARTPVAVSFDPFDSGCLLVPSLAASNGLAIVAPASTTLFSAYYQCVGNPSKLGVRVAPNAN